jgi:hypothetical protein
MNDKFDELAKSMARSVSRRGALRKFGLGLGSALLASLGLTKSAQADPRTPFHCRCNKAAFGCTTADCLLICIDVCSLKR